MQSKITTMERFSSNDEKLKTIKPLMKTKTKLNQSKREGKREREKA